MADKEDKTKSTPIPVTMVKAGTTEEIPEKTLEVNQNNRAFEAAKKVADEDGSFSKGRSAAAASLTKDKNPHKLGTLFKEMADTSDRANLVNRAARVANTEEEIMARKAKRNKK